MAASNFMFLTALLLGTTSGFSPSGWTASHSLRDLACPPKRMSLQNVENTCASLVLASLLSLTHPAVSIAASQAPCISTIVVSENIKTLDLELPSYDNLSDAKASVKNTEGLAVELEPGLEAAGKKDPGPQLNSVLRSMGNREKKESKGNEKSVWKQKEEEAKEKQLRVVDMSLPSYGESTTMKEKGLFSI
mmetsp:Transcript_7714/g.13332  ORF Transcript_7714/g.13332 Transcript_7714/m.13332 type:complete len:191 (-) Transcript_7714:886-1458(-)